MADILVLTSRFPFPVVAGDSLRIFHVCKALSREHSLTLLSLCKDERAADKAGPGRDVFDRIETIRLPTWRSVLNTARNVFSKRPLQLVYYSSSRYADRVEALLPEHDLVLAHLIRTGQYVEHRAGVPKVLEMTDAISMNYQRVSKLGRLHPKHLVYRLEASRLLPYERETLQHFDLVSLIAAADRNFLLEGCQVSASKIQVNPNGVDVQRLPCLAPADNPVIAFIGNMRTVPNVDACEFFIDSILPGIRERIPEASFRIIGHAPRSILRKWEKEPHVTMTGYVERISDAAQGAMCGMGAMRVGAGVQNKILEYMALGLPVVATPLSMEGLDVTPDENVLVGETPDELVDQFVRVLDTPPLREGLSKRGRSFVEEAHRWDSMLRGLVDGVNRLLEEQDVPAQRDVSS